MLIFTEVDMGLTEYNNMQGIEERGREFKKEKLANELIRQEILKQEELREKNSLTLLKEEMGNFANIKSVNAERYTEWDEKCYQPEESFLNIEGCKDLMLDIISGEQKYWDSVLGFIQRQEKVVSRLAELGESEDPERISPCDTSDSVGCRRENVQRKLRNKEKETNDLERDYLQKEKSHVEELLKEVSLDEVKLRQLGMDNEVLEGFSVSEEDIEDLLEVFDENYSTIENAEIVEAENIEDIFDQTN